MLYDGSHASKFVITTTNPTGAATLTENNR